jgi:uncharacterized SAM-binding protein YcdF (DUF218 family)
MTRRLKWIVLLLLVVIAFGAAAGWLLVKDNAKKSDAIVVLDGGHGDFRYQKALELLQKDYAKVLFRDARTDVTLYGHTPAEMAAAWEKESAGQFADRVKVCPTMEDGTQLEAKYVLKCMQSVNARTGLLVTSDYHTRRALSTFQKKIPGVEWTVASFNDPNEFGVKWWQKREWAKTLVGEWERLVWWNLVDRWR